MSQVLANALSASAMLSADEIEQDAYERASMSPWSD